MSKLGWAGQLDQRLDIVRFAEQWLDNPAPVGMLRDVYRIEPSEYIRRIEAGEKRIHWCGGFAIWCIWSVLGKPEDPSWRLDVGQGVEQYLNRGLKRTNKPDLADIAVGPAPAYHHTLIRATSFYRSTRSSHSYIGTIGGNQGAGPGTVGTGRHVFGAEHSYYSIEGWLE